MWVTAHQEFADFFQSIFLNYKNSVNNPVCLLMVKNKNKNPSC